MQVILHEMDKSFYMELLPETVEDSAQLIGATPVAAGFYLHEG